MSGEISLIDPAWELIDPNPNIWSLFKLFDERFFHNRLTQSCVELMWSSNRMTSTAGLCAWNPRTNYAAIKLSQPLLQLRSRSDLVETLLHEMIHAFLFVTREDDNHESHGPKFHMHMYRINKEAGTNITVYHTFHDEVRHYQQHIWRCDGPCAQRPPYYGYVRRANNRKPGPYDYWWSQHGANCGGTFTKISEPDKIEKPKQGKQGKITAEEIKNNKRISDFFKISPKSISSSSKGASSNSNSVNVTPKSIKSPPAKMKDIREYISPAKSPIKESFPGQGYRLGSSLENGHPVKKLKTEKDDKAFLPTKNINRKPNISSAVKTVHDTGDFPKPIFAGITNCSPLKKEGYNAMPKSNQPSCSTSKDNFSSPVKKQNSIKIMKENDRRTCNATDCIVDDDEESSFTYDLPDFDIPDEILLTDSPFKPNNCSSKVSKPLISNSVLSELKTISEQDQDEDVFTYELPDFVPFLGTGYKLGSKTYTSSTSKSKSIPSCLSSSPTIVKLD